MGYSGVIMETLFGVWSHNGETMGYYGHNNGVTMVLEGHYGDTIRVRGS